MFATLILLVISSVAIGAEENVAFFDNLECNFNKDYCGTTGCILTPHNDKQSEQKVSILCELKKPIDKIQLSVIIFAKELNTNLVDVREDFCGFMSGKADSKILTILMPYIKKYSNINHPCPYSGSADIKELPLGSHLLASHEIPSGDYILTTKITSDGIFVSNTTSQLHIPEGKMVNGK